MTTHNLLLIPGDGIGPEVMAEVERVLALLNKSGKSTFKTDTALAGGCSIDKHGVPLTDEALAKCKAADAIIFGSVGGPKWDKVKYENRPEAGLLRIRKELDLFANLRPAICYPALAEASSLKRELVEGLDILIIRELTGGEDIDIVFEHPGRETFGASVFVTRKGGTITTCVSTSG
ncbi:MAG TPA: isocitrate/isopropylmalate family dehydrogenase, partial [Hyphomicrobiaceae bacterium]|nr:isocitrate/isopropylmalate family dehydrogenase [Hyphomicrobiaceae bacterium]